MQDSCIIENEQIERYELEDANQVFDRTAVRRRLEERQDFSCFGTWIDEAALVANPVLPVVNPVPPVAKRAGKRTLRQAPAPVTLSVPFDLGTWDITPSCLKMQLAELFYKGAKSFAIQVGEIRQEDAERAAADASQSQAEVAVDVRVGDILEEEAQMPNEPAFADIHVDEDEDVFAVLPDPWEALTPIVFIPYALPRYVSLTLTDPPILPEVRQ